MKIGILGSGDVARSLGEGFVSAGDIVMLGSRDKKNAKIEAWVKNSSHGRSGGSFNDAAQFGEIIVLATLGTVTEEAINLAGVANFDGKIVIDATNPLEFVDNRPRLAGGLGSSGGEKVQQLLSKARIVKCFNTVGHALMYQPKFTQGKPDMFICGDDIAAKKTVAGICDRFGWGVVDCGGISSSHYLEAMCLVWVLAGFQDNHWHQAFRLLRQ